jgi:serine/threonine protein kinase
MRYKAPIHSTIDIEHWRRMLREGLADKDATHLLLPVGYDVEEGDVCESSSYLVLRFKEYRYSLEQEIKHRRLHNNRFKKSEITGMLAVLLRLVQQFEGDNLKVGDIRPSQILLNEQGHVAVVSPYSWPNSLTNFQKSHETGDGGYLAPEELEEIRRKNFFPALRAGPCDVFSAGLTLLDMALLCSCSDLYSPDHELDFDMLANRVERVQGVYGGRFRDTLKGMLSKNPETRFTCSMIV